MRKVYDRLTDIQNLQDKFGNRQNNLFNLINEIDKIIDNEIYRRAVLKINQRKPITIEIKNPKFIEHVSDYLSKCGWRVQTQFIKKLNDKTKSSIMITFPCDPYVKSYAPK